MKVEPVDKKLRNYKPNWLRNVKRINNMVKKMMLIDRQNVIRRLGRSLKRLLEEVETGL